MKNIKSINELFGGDRNQQSFTLAQVKEMCFIVMDKGNINEYLYGTDIKSIGNDREKSEFDEWWNEIGNGLFIKICQENP